MKCEFIYNNKSFVGQINADFSEVELNLDRIKPQWAENCKIINEKKPPVLFIMICRTKDDTCLNNPDFKLANNKLGVCNKVKYPGYHRSHDR